MQYDNDQACTTSENNPHYPTTQTFYSRRKVKHNILKDKPIFSNTTQSSHSKLTSDRYKKRFISLILLKQM